MLRAGVRTPRQLAAELGCAEQTLRNWWRQDQADQGERDDLLSSEERQRLRELERENKVLRQEREIRLSPVGHQFPLGSAAPWLTRRADRRPFIWAGLRETETLGP